MRFKGIWSLRGVSLVNLKVYGFWVYFVKGLYLFIRMVFFREFVVGRGECWFVFRK